mmetsp:Transcript_8583/g.20496  ORF Transcript_8583/g.20496 Transcript_8583/m.20496 type:complete len:101 (-) Transcript_8583:193-495(-)
MCTLWSGCIIVASIHGRTRHAHTHGNDNGLVGFVSGNIVAKKSRDDAAQQGSFVFKHRSAVLEREPLGSRSIPASSVVGSCSRRNVRLCTTTKKKNCIKL